MHPPWEWTRPCIYGGMHLGRVRILLATRDMRDIVLKKILFIITVKALYNEPPVLRIFVRYRERSL